MRAPQCDEPFQCSYRYLEEILTRKIGAFPRFGHGDQSRGDGWDPLGRAEIRSYPHLLQWRPRRETRNKRIRVTKGMEI